MSNIHPLSVVHPKAILGKDVTIDPFVVIQEDVVIGDGSHIMSQANIMAGTRLGENCRVFPGAVVGAIPQDLKFKGEYTILEVGNNVTIRECCTINRGTEASGKTKVGDNVLLMAYVHVAHDCIIGDSVILVNNVNLAGHVEIGDYAILGGMSAVHQFVKIGVHAMIGGGSLVRKDVPPYIKVAREPLSYIGVNSIGLKRRGFSEDTINDIQHIYRSVFIRNANLVKAIEEVEEMNIESETVKNNVLAFLKKSERGIVKGYRPE